MRTKATSIGMLTALTLCFDLAVSIALVAGTMDDAKAHQPPSNKLLKVSSASYEIPSIWLVRDDGRKVYLPQEINDGRPTVLNFIYTTCPGVCPLMSQVFSRFQSRLGAHRTEVHMVSISIDPEQDTPARLHEYARQFAAGSQWQHYTGTVAASIAAQTAFNTYNGDKMMHDPLTLMRAAPGQPWVRVEGFATAEDLLLQYRKLTAR